MIDFQRGGERCCLPEYWSRFAGLAGSLNVEVSMLEGTAGDHLYLYRAGPAQGEEIILVSPPESPFLLVSNMFTSLANAFHVTSWDSSFAPYMEVSREAPPLTVERAADGLTSVVSEVSSERIHLVTWSSGALVALWAFSSFRETVASVTLIAPPSIVGDAPERTPFQSDYLKMVFELAGSSTRDEAELQERIRSVPRSRPIHSQQDELLFELAYLPLRNDDSIKQYAKLVKDACTKSPPAEDGVERSEYREVMSDIARSVPTQLMHCRDDEVVSYRSSMHVAANNDVRFVLYPAGGHFVIFYCPRMLSAGIESFIR